jgi:hypothetical protein
MNRGSLIGKMTRLRVELLGSNPGVDEKFLLQNIQTGSRPYAMMSGVSFLGVKRPGRAVYPSPPYSANV